MSHDDPEQDDRDEPEATNEPDSGHRPAEQPAASDSQARGQAQPASQKHSAEFLAWVRAQSSDEEVLAGIREVEETGGLELKDFIHELKEVLALDD